MLAFASLSFALCCHLRFARHCASLSFALRASLRLRLVISLRCHMRCARHFASLSYALRASLRFAVICAARVIYGHWWLCWGEKFFARTGGCLPRFVVVSHLMLSLKPFQLQ